jgi:hypothetical protein
VKADLEWTDRIDNRVKRKTRITFVGHDKIKWQFKRSDEDAWDYDTPPTPADWESLEEKIDALYHRRRQPFKHLELVQQLRKAAERN